MSNEQFNLRPAAVDGWLKHLPLGSIGETARQLYQALRSVNRQEDAAVKDYFYFLEAIAEPLNLVLPELHKHYIGKPLPLSTKRRKVAEVYTQLLRQAIEGYQRVISSSAELGRFGWKKTVTTSVLRIFNYQSLLLCNYRLLYQPIPRGTWQQLYWSYQLLERNELLDSKANSLSDGDAKTTLANEFRKLLLISLLSPSLFNAAELQQIMSLLDHWISHTHVIDHRPQAVEHVYAFLLDTDMPPGLITSHFAQFSTVMSIRYFNIAPLITFIQTLLTQEASQHGLVKLDRQQTISRRTLLLLLNSWGRQPTRDNERRSMTIRAELAIGMSAIHYLLNEGRSADNTAVASTTMPTKNKLATSCNADTDISPNSSFNLLGFATHRDDSQDVWETAFFDPAPPPPSWTESIRMKAYTYLPVRIINISQGGFCIEIAENSIEHIQVGELVAIRDNQAQWQLCEIRWMVCPSSGTLRAGVKKLCQTVYPAMVHLTSRQQTSQPIRALVGEQNNKTLLFIPTMLNRIDSKDLILEFNGQQHRFRYQTNHDDVTISECRVIQLLGNDEKAMATTADPTAPAKNTDHFAKVWASL